MIDNDNSIIESLNSINFNEPHPVELPSARGKNIVNIVMVLSIINIAKTKIQLFIFVDILLIISNVIAHLN